MTTKKIILCENLKIEKKEKKYYIHLSNVLNLFLKRYNTHIESFSSMYM